MVGWSLKAGLCGFVFFLPVMTEYTVASHPQQLSCKMLAFLSPTDCLADLVNLLELEALEQQVVGDILFHENMSFL